MNALYKNSCTRDLEIRKVKAKHKLSKAMFMDFVRINLTRFNRKSLFVFKNRTTVREELVTKLITL